MYQGRRQRVKGWSTEGPFYNAYFLWSHAGMQHNDMSFFYVFIDIQADISSEIEHLITFHRTKIYAGQYVKITAPMRSKYYA